MTSATDPLAPPRFGGDGNPQLWARRVTKWVRAHEALSRANHKHAYPVYIRCYVLSQALYGTARRTVESTLSDGVISSEEGVKEIVNLLAKFNPTTFAHEIFSNFKIVMQTRRNKEESFKLYVNRFEAAASELRNLTKQNRYGEAEQLLAFQLLEGAQIPTAVFLQVLSSCIAEEKISNEDGTCLSQKNRLTQVKDKLAEMADHYEFFERDRLSEALEVVSSQQAAAIKEMFRSSMENVKYDVEKIKRSIEEDISELPCGNKVDIDKNKMVTIDFESAKKALRGLDAVSTKEQVVASKMECHNGVDHAVVERIVHQTIMSQKRDTKFGPPGGGPSSTKKHKN